jgi:hypothetical protein
MRQREFGSLGQQGVGIADVRADIRRPKNGFLQAQAVRQFVAVDV